MNSDIRLHSGAQALHTLTSFCRDARCLSATLSLFMVLTEIKLCYPKICQFGIRIILS